MDNELSREINKFCEENYDNILRDIARLVAVNSVEGEGQENAPFGKGPAEALKLGLEISRELGLESYNCENRIGYALLGDNSDRYLATITHLDVVPAGDGWKADPFKMRVRDGWLIGRGVLDDKGPSVICLYALKYLKEHRVPLRYPVRALLGINEETGMLDVEHYLKNYPAPLFCFSPDAEFPICNGEKGIFHGKIVSKLPVGKDILEISGGVAANVIPAKAVARVRAGGLESTEKLTVKELEDGVWELEAHGRGGHASMPEGTENAVGILLRYMLNNNIGDENDRRFIETALLIQDDWKGGLVGVAASDEMFGSLTLISGVVGIEEGHLVMSLDCRYPTTTSGEKVAAGIAEKAGDDMEVIMGSDSAPFYMSLDNPALQVCMRAYNEVTGEQAEPFTIGGGTYARDFPNGISFGPEHPERKAPDFAGPIHGAEEAACAQWLIEALKVYIVALIELQKLDF